MFLHKDPCSLSWPWSDHLRLCSMSWTWHMPFYVDYKLFIWNTVMQFCLWSNDVSAGKTHQSHLVRNYFVTLGVGDNCRRRWKAMVADWLFAFCFLQSSGTEEMVWEQYTVTLQRVRSPLFITQSPVFTVRRGHWNTVFPSNLIFKVSCNLSGTFPLMLMMQLGHIAWPGIRFSSCRTLKWGLALPCRVVGTTPTWRTVRRPSSCQTCFRGARPKAYSCKCHSFTHILSAPLCRGSVI